MTTVSISRAWDEARGILEREGKLLSAVALALVVLPQVVAGVVAPPVVGQEVATQSLGLIAGLIGVAAQLALIRLAIGPSVSVGDAIGHGFRRLPMLLLGMILLGALFFVLVIPFAIVGAAMGISVTDTGQVTDPRAGVLVLALLTALVALSARFVLMAPAASAERLGPVAVIRRSWHLTAGNYWRFLALVILLLLLAALLIVSASLLGGIIGKLIDPEMTPFSLGAFVLAVAAGLAQAVFTVIASVLLARIYVQLAGSDEGSVSVPHTR